MKSEPQHPDDCLHDNASLDYLSEEQINAFWAEKADQRARDARLVQEGKIKAQDLSWPHIFGWNNGQIEWSAADAAIAADEEWEATDD
jgi:hypothetical protein